MKLSYSLIARNIGPRMIEEVVDQAVGFGTTLIISRAAQSKQTFLQWGKLSKSVVSELNSNYI